MPWKHTPKRDNVRVTLRDRLEYRDLISDLSRVDPSFVSAPLRTWREREITTEKAELTMCSLPAINRLLMTCEDPIPQVSILQGTSNKVGKVAEGGRGMVACGSNLASIVFAFAGE